ncbi:MAG: response regulator transcription factor [Ignavibacteriales bacterium]|nr:response regulator transcription factor [Ignavibacteriales bacterium]
MDKIRVLLADDHALVRSGLIRLLEPHKDIVVIGEAEDGEEAIRMAKQLKPDVVVIDLSMPKVSGIEASKILKKECPSAHVLVLTMHENEEYVYQILKSGAGGYILKNAGRDEIATGIRSVAKGERFFSPRVSEIMVEGYLKKAQEREKKTQEPEVPLTAREKEVLMLIAEGMNNQQIAEKLYISPRTADTHRTNIMQKLDIHDAANLVRYALERGLRRKGPEVS